MKIYNAFGIKPTNTFVSAGSDYYIPNIKSEREKKLAFKAFEKSYKMTYMDLIKLNSLFETLVPPKYIENIHNLIHLYLGLYSASLSSTNKNLITKKAVKYFIDNYVVYDENKDVVGIKLKLNDTLFINSGIKIALDSLFEDQMVYPLKNRIIMSLRSIGMGIAGLYVNKSGKGNAGYDIRACLIDSDYSGYVHLSVAFTKDTIGNDGIVYCGDKLTQMMLVPVFHTQYEEISEDEYDKIMSESDRGDSGFGSSDVKH